MGLVWGKGPKAVRSGVFGTDWGTLSDSEMTRIHTRMCDRLRDQPYGPFEALTSLFGPTRAREISPTECTALLVAPHNPIKRKSSNQESSDEEDVIFTNRQRML
jgi:hypothetical protein